MGEGAAAGVLPIADFADSENVESLRARWVGKLNGRLEFSADCWLLLLLHPFDVPSICMCVCARASAGIAIFYFAKCVCADLCVWLGVWVALEGAVLICQMSRLDDAIVVCVACCIVVI